MNELALFAGAGGGILGGTLLGWRTVCAVEIEPYPASVLAQRQNDGLLPPFPIWDDVCTFDGNPWRGIVDVISGGFPCQDISAAGRGAGIGGERSGLWKEYARIIGEVRPRFVLVENSPLLTLRGLGTVLGDLSAMGYDASWGVISAADAGAPHLRERIWIVGHAIGCGLGGIARGWAGAELADGYLRMEKEPLADAESAAARAGFDLCGRESDARPSCEDVADADEIQRNGSRGAWDGRAESTDSCEDGCDSHLTRLAQREGECGDNGTEQSPTLGTNWWAVEPDVGRVAHGVAARVDRLKAIGNGQVPAVVRIAWEILAAQRQVGRDERCDDCDRDSAINAFRMDELDAVMITVDKWLEGQALKNNPATRAADAREIALKAIEAEHARADKLNKCYAAVVEIARKYHYGQDPACPFCKALRDLDEARLKS